MMPPWLTEILRFLGFTTPLIYGAATYQFFHYLDKNASGPAKKAIAGWLQPKEYDRVAVANAIVEIFDRIYTRPLLGWRALTRSALFTVCISAIFLYELSPSSVNVWLGAIQAESSAWFAILAVLLPNIGCDYIALFIIRHFLALGGDKPILTLLIGPLAGISSVLVMLVLRAVLILGWALWLDLLTFDHRNWAEVVRHPLLASVIDPGFRELSLAALVVHLWLPLFGLCVVLLKATNYFRAAVGHTQWFFKRGRDRPLDAIGYVAASIIVVVAFAVQVVQLSAR
jgi:hypothetical protein